MFYSININPNVNTTSDNDPKQMTRTLHQKQLHDFSSIQPIEENVRLKHQTDMAMSLNCSNNANVIYLKTELQIESRRTEIEISNHRRYENS